MYKLKKNLWIVNLQLAAFGRAQSADCCFCVCASVVAVFNFSLFSVVIVYSSKITKQFISV